MNRGRQSGVGLIEVLIAVVILSVGVLGAAALMLNSLKYTDSASMRSQASFIAYDMLDRIRANAGSAATLNSYNLASLANAPASGSTSAPVTQDLYDFKVNIQSTLGSDASASITYTASTKTVAIMIQWVDSRALQSSSQAISGSSGSATTQTLNISSRIINDQG